MSIQIAYVDDHFTAREELHRLLSPHFDINFFRNPMQLLAKIKHKYFPIVLASDELSPINGMELFRRLKRQSVQIQKVLVCKQSAATSASADITFANFDATPKSLLQLIDMAVIAMYQQEESRGSSDKFIGQCAQIRQLYTYAKRIAQSDRPILISGETGTGKDLFARQIHQFSPRHHSALQFVNCAAISPELFESEFFGHIKGAFTGATHDRHGHFNLADNGTLVLDEISELDLRFQVKLLRAIENQEIYQVGSQNVIKLNTRIIALTNRNLQQEIAEGRFRADLYHRLNSFQLTLPPLRERESDIRLLAEHFFSRSWLSLMDNWKSLIGEGVYQILERLNYEGNIRDLQNLITKVLSHKNPTAPQIRQSDLEAALPSEVLSQLDNLGVEENLNEFLRRMERSKIFEELHRNNFNVTQTARQLGLSRQSLQHRLRRHNFEA